MLNRRDRLAFLAPWKKACPVAVDGDDERRALLLAHLLGEGAPEATARWISAKKSGTETGRFRLGTYSPDRDGMTLFGVIDCDGGGRHNNPLADPLGVALAILVRLERLSLTAYLEQSGSGTGWHVWVFFLQPVPAALVRRLLFPVCPADAPLKTGSMADAGRNSGLEVFPKQDAIEPDGLGNQVWLTWWSGAEEGANLFYAVGDGGELAPSDPDSFLTVTPDELRAAVTQAESQAQHGPSAKGKGPGKAGRVKQPAGGVAWNGSRVSSGSLLQRALGRCGDGRNSAGLWLACQLRDNERGLKEGPSGFTFRVKVAEGPFKNW
jgi:hypothetical protein